MKKLFSLAVMFLATGILNADVLIDDFEDVFHDAANQAHIGAAYGYAGETEKPKDGESWWYVYGDGGSVVLSAEGEEIDSDNADEMIEDGALHVEFDVSGSSEEYPYVGIGVNFPVDEIYDLSSMTAITLRVKGEGTVNFKFSTEIVKGYDWGDFGVDITLSSSWKEITIDLDDIIPTEYSPVADDGLTWDDAKDEVSAIQIQIVDNGELYLDDLVLVGVEYEDFGFTYREYGESMIRMDKKGNFMLGNNAQNAFTQGTNISFNLPAEQKVSLKVFNANGNLIKTLFNGIAETGETSIIWNTTDENGSKVSSGAYIYKQQIGSKVITGPIFLTK